MARVPEDERLRIVELYTKEYSQRAVAAMVKRPLKTVNRIIQAFRDENRIKDAPRKPRPRRRLAEAGLKSRMAVQKPLLTNVNKSKRLSFTSGMKRGPLTIGAEWSSATSARSRPNGIRGPVSGVQIELVAARTDCGERWGCITRDGLGPLVRIQGAFTADKYRNIWTPHITPQHDCIFQHDRSPVHTAKRSIAYYSSAE
ncbi:hypothetical protein HPB52_025408 [Rhipicephalus sanguineus]|uniref:Uncharacterized protein n=1 Tax=Rhipicephalus sanguineus TaxID=34632 RepID=A0A9D4TD41_RHISA|nr:hypothetical protein HPB52_025408 [Rhipicephalus sanguineus]